jgi:integrase
MPKRATPLTAVAVKNAKPGIYVDGGGLQLVVKPTGAAAWIYRYTLAGRRRDMGLGPARGPAAIALAEARGRAGKARELIQAGVDPLEKRESNAAAAKAAAEASARRAVRFQDVADRYIAAHEVGWRGTKTRASWNAALREYAFPHFGEVPVSAIETQYVEAALRPLWLAKPETASKLRGRIEAILDFAAVQGWRDGANPARWRGHLDKLFPSRSKVKPVKHHAALPWPHAGPLMAALRARDAMAARALEFAILTAARSGEVLGARWPEIDLEGAVWTVPKGRMKAGREHRVPLAPAAVALLSGLLPLRAAEEDAVVFPGQRGGRPLSVMAMAMVLRRMGRGDLTVHGFRSTFRDWAGETTHHAREVVEAALAHRLGDRVEQAYARGDLFTKRRRLMEDWAAFCAEAPAGMATSAECGPVEAQARSPL